ncbi:amidohydrolase [Neotabrizicola shimadae]|uniref:Amidohydrolase n=1 Tax=Neotabrizicola shimadae TaxID=2807096 RepID=A0A8G0ZX22_9RHOB|nr:amidohydrolase [Neotabrizicola shimadae]QYZ69609.1 amidohydrolase [Neotabrizicola shimadae]
MTTQADILIHNAKVLTGDPSCPRADWVAISGRKIQSVGQADQAPPLGPLTRRLDGQGATLTAGLNDAHLHLFGGGLSLADLSLAGVMGLDAFRAAVSDYRARHPGLRFLAAQSCDYHIVSAESFPDRHILDDLCPDIPMMVMAVDYHTAWVNTAALKLAGIERGADLSPGNVIVLDDAGNATGTLLEFEAIDLVRQVNPAAARHFSAAQDPFRRPNVSEADRSADRETLWTALTHCAAQGLTAVQNMDGSLYQLELLAELDASRGLPVRVRVPFHIQQGHGPADLAHAVRWRKAHQSEMLRCDFVKIFADGVIDSGTAFMLEDYSHTPGNRGTALFSDEELNAIITEADRLGFQVAVHCVGDGAVRQVLNAYEAAQKANGRRDSRHRIEHIEVIDPADIPRFAELGVVASMQPTHTPEGGEGYLDLIGPARGRYAFALADLRAAGAAFVFATDWPVAPLEPGITLAAAVHRPDWSSGGPVQRVDLATALYGITEAAAWVAFDEAARGRIAPGLAADLTLFDRDIEAADEAGLAESGARLTICAGRLTHNNL